MAKAKTELQTIVDALSSRAQMWFWSFVKHRDATRAAIDAGYVEKSARQQGHRMLTNPNVARCVDWHDNQAADGTGVMSKKVIACWTMSFLTMH